MGAPVPPEAVGSAAEAALEGAQHVTVKAMLLGTGPRFARDAFGPVLAFYVGWKWWGLGVGIAASTVVSLLSWWYERTRDRRGRIALISLGFVVVQAAIGLISGSGRLYLAQPVLLSAAFGIAFLVSVAIKRPLAGVFASELYPFPDEVKESATFVRVFGAISLAWGVYQVGRSAIRLVVLNGNSVEAFLAVNFVTGVPLTMSLMSWSIWYAVRGFRTSDEWGWAMRGDEPPAPGALR
jgi:intracellular septation protein A